MVVAVFVYRGNDHQIHTGFCDTNLAAKFVMANNTATTNYWVLWLRVGTEHVGEFKHRVFAPTSTL